MNLLKPFQNFFEFTALQILSNFHAVIPRSEQKAFAQHYMSMEFHLAWLECFFLQSSPTASKRAKAQEFAHIQVLFWYLKQHMKARNKDHVNSSIKYEHGNTSIVPICASRCASHLCFPLKISFLINMVYRFTMCSIIGLTC